MLSLRLSKFSLNITLFHLSPSTACSAFDTGIWLALPMLEMLGFLVLAVC